MINKSVTAIGGTACALFLGCGVAHADPIDDAINLYSHTPGMVQFLQTARSLDPAFTVESVEYAAGIAGFYCFVPAADLHAAGLTLDQWQSMLADMLTQGAVSAGTPPATVNAQITALNVLCP